MNVTQQYKADEQRYLDNEMNLSEEADYLARLSETDREELHATDLALNALERLPRLPAPVNLADNIMAAIVPKRQSALARLRTWMELRPLLGWEFAGTGFAAYALIAILAPMSLTHTGGDVMQMASSSSLSRVAHLPSGDGNVMHFSLYAPQANSIILVGDFNGWGSDSEISLKPVGNGTWGVTTPLPSGRYQYAFLVDGQRWVTDPNAEQHINDDFGRQNAVVTIL